MTIVDLSAVDQCLVRQATRGKSLFRGRVSLKSAFNPKQEVTAAWVAGRFTLPLEGTVALANP